MAWRPRHGVSATWVGSDVPGARGCSSGRSATASAASSAAMPAGATEPTRAPSRVAFTAVSRSTKYQPQSMAASRRSRNTGRTMTNSMRTAPRGRRVGWEALMASPTGAPRRRRARSQLPSAPSRALQEAGGMAAVGRRARRLAAQPDEVDEAGRERHRGAGDRREGEEGKDQRGADPDCGRGDELHVAAAELARHPGRGGAARGRRAPPAPRGPPRPALRPATARPGPPRRWEGRARSGFAGRPRRRRRRPRAGFRAGPGS